MKITWKSGLVLGGIIIAAVGAVAFGFFKLNQRENAKYAEMLASLQEAE